MNDSDYYDPDLRDLLMACAREQIAGRELHSPGYRFAIEENPELWEECLEQAMADAERDKAFKEESLEALEGRVEDAKDAELYEPTLDELFAMREKIGRFEPAHITMGLRAKAEQLAKEYDGDFEYMIEMKKWVKTRRLSIGQAKGVLNSVTARRPATHSGGGRTATPKPVVELEAGCYYKDGDVYKVKRAVHGSGRMYALKLVVEANKGAFLYDRGAIYNLLPEDKLTLEKAREYGAIYGCCCVCGATLTDERSIEAGIGPVCAGRL